MPKCKTCQATCIGIHCERCITKQQQELINECITCGIRCARDTEYCPKHTKQLFRHTGVVLDETKSAPKKAISNLTALKKCQGCDQTCRGDFCSDCRASNLHPCKTCNEPTNLTYCSACTKKYNAQKPQVSCGDCGEATTNPRFCDDCVTRFKATKKEKLCEDCESEFVVGKRFCDECFMNFKKPRPCAKCGVEVIGVVFCAACTAAYKQSKLASAS